MDADPASDFDTTVEQDRWFVHAHVVKKSVSHAACLANRR
jgi:hypothetical protein